MDFLSLLWWNVNLPCVFEAPLGLIFLCLQTPRPPGSAGVFGWWGPAAPAV